MDTKRIDVGFRLAYVRLANLQADEYQRDRKPSIVARIAGNYNAPAVGVLTISKRNGNHYVVDGCHRVEALRALFGDDAEVAVLLYENLTLEQEIRLFLDLNSGQKPSPIDRFNARLVLGDAVAQELVEFVRKHGYDIYRPRTVLHSGHTGMAGVAELESMFTANPDGLSKAMDFTKAAFPKESAPAVYTLSGLAVFLSKVPKNFDVDELVRIVINTGLTSGELKRNLEGLASSKIGFARDDSRGGDRVALGLVYMYNAQKAKGKRTVAI